MSKKLGEILVEEGKLTEAQLQKALKAQLIFGGHLGTSLIELGYVDEETLGETLSRAFRVPYASFDILSSVPYSVVRAIPAKLVEKYKVVPIRLDGKVLQLAMMDPKNLMALDEISFVTGYKIDPWVAPEIRIFQVLEKYYNVPRSQRYISLARELGKLRSRGEKISPARADRPASESSWDDGASAATAPEHSTEPVPSVAALPPKPASEAAPARPAPDHWEKYGYGKSWREFAEAMERTSPTPPPEPPRPVPERPQPAPRGGPGGSTESELEHASQRLAACATPDEVADVVLAFAGRFLKRTAFFVMRGDQAVAWGGTGEGFSSNRLKGMSLPLVRDSLFSLVDDRSRHFLGAMPAFPSVRKLFQELSAPMPRTAFVLPIRIKDKLASVLYGDGAADDDLRNLDVDAFERLGKKVSFALQMIIFRNKILSA
jgi:hypothetical protein